MRVTALAMVTASVAAGAHSGNLLLFLATACGACGIAALAPHTA